MTDDMGCDLEFPDVDKLTFPQWRDWLAEYNKFIGERDVRYAAGLRARDDRIETLTAALRKIADIEHEDLPKPAGAAEGTLWVILAGCVEVAEKALGGKALGGKDD